MGSRGRRVRVPIHSSALKIKISPSKARAIDHLLAGVTSSSSKFFCSSSIARNSVVLCLHFKVQVVVRKRKLAGSSTAIFTAPLARCQSGQATNSGLTKPKTAKTGKPMRSTVSTSQEIRTPDTPPFMFAGRAKKR